MTGYKSEETKGQFCRDILNHHDSKGDELCDTRCPLLESLKEKRETLYDEVWMKTKKGTRKAVELSCSPVIDEDGNLLGAVEIFRDRTKQKELERMKEEFIATITHDLKSPLSSIIGFTHLIADPSYGEIAPSKLEYIKIIQQSGAILLSLINNILDASRIEAGQMIYTFDDFLLNDLFRELNETFSAQAIQQDIKMVFELPEDLWANADINKMRQVFHNLISNAFRYTPRGGIISIMAKDDGERIHIEVSDTGKGIPESDHHKIFQKFAQIKGERRGTGLGLYIVKTILKGHGSDITFKSAPGIGTTFFFSLPKGKSTPKREIQSKRLLIVGDIAKSAYLTKNALEKMKHIVEHVFSAMEGLQKAEEIKPDLIITFRDLPDLTIDEFIYSLNINPVTRDIPVVLLSTIILPEFKGKFKAVIPLPLDMHIFIDEMNKIL